MKIETGSNREGMLELLGIQPGHIMPDSLEIDVDGIMTWQSAIILTTEQRQAWRHATELDTEGTQ